MSEMICSKHAIPFQDVGDKRSRCPKCIDERAELDLSEPAKDFRDFCPSDPRGPGRPGR